MGDKESMVCFHIHSCVYMGILVYTYRHQKDIQQNSWQCFFFFNVEHDGIIKGLNFYNEYGLFS